MNEHKPELFSDSDTSLQRGQILEAVVVPITPDGCYNGNGQYRKANGQCLEIIGFNKIVDPEKEHTWYGRGWIKKRRY